MSMLMFIVSECLLWFRSSCRHFRSRNSWRWPPRRQ